MTAPSPLTLGIIPARFGSTRFPGKPLAMVGGKPLLQRTFERALQCPSLDRLLIATDHDEIARVARSFGAEVVMTRPDHPTGTDRIAEAAAHFPEAQHILNIQGDEPLIDPLLIETLAATLRTSPHIDIVTAANRFGPEDIHDPNYVKVVLSRTHEALYFSRQPIPFRREPQEDLPFYRHKGVYGFQRQALQRFVSLEPGPLEKAEQLEQLRALENAMRIHVTITNDTSIGLDSPDQIPLIESQLLLLDK